MNLTEFRQGMSKVLLSVAERGEEYPLERYNTETVAWVVPYETVAKSIHSVRMRVVLEMWREALEGVDFSAIPEIDYDSLPWEETDAAISQNKFLSRRD